jgi:CRISPR-associated endonuclease/helicase Cas3
MLSFKELFENALLVDNLLQSPEKYLAHLPHSTLNGQVTQNDETLGEHMTLVLKNAQNLCNANKIEPIVDDLIKKMNLQDESSEDYIKKLFVNAIVFHDFGKINKFFQTDRMKNKDAIFQKPSPIIFFPKHGHSELGAYIYTVFHLEEIHTQMPEDFKVKLSALVFAFANSILLHHNPQLLQPKQKLKKSQFLEKKDKLLDFLKFYKGFPEVDIADWYFQEIEMVLNELENSEQNFSLFALLRLNFSLLTAADYIATGEYTNQLPISDFGILSKEKRNGIIRASKESQYYNQKAYKLFESGYDLQHPTKVDEHGDNLNILRTEMAVEVLTSLERNHDKRIFYLEAPTGGGKTNLSMLAVGQLLKQNTELNKVFYVFPFTTLITQTHKSILDTLAVKDELGNVLFGIEPDDIALMHSRAGFQTLAENKKNPENETDESQEDGLYGDKKRDFMQNQFALYPFSLITHILFFDILKSNRKEDIYLMHRLANSIVVLDELQTYPPKMWDKMMNMIDQYSRCLNMRFILMSATLPRIDKIEAVKNAALSSGGMPEIIDLLPNPKRYFINENFKGRVKFNFDLLDTKNEMTQEDLADAVLGKSRARAEAHEGRVFTIVEFIFKRSATEFKTTIEANKPFFDEIYVLSGTILEHRRREIIYYLKKNRRTPNLKVLLITTQVVEAGVDIDMDLGFKNISLIDSDEQLAGRVNRNVNKTGCEVYLFNMNDASVLYKSDIRFKITREMDTDFHRKILENKDFNLLYEEVFKKIDKGNESDLIPNFRNKYLPYFQTLDFPNIHKEFKLIDQETLSVFVPIRLPIEILNEKGEMEDFFSDFEKNFLKIHNAYWEGEPFIDGENVWEVFQKLETNSTGGFVDKKIGKKAIQGIISKFTFSLFASPANRLNLVEFSNIEKSLENYFYLNHHARVYDIESGLDEKKLKDPDTII